MTSVGEFCCQTRKNIVDLSSGMARHICSQYALFSCFLQSITLFTLWSGLSWRPLVCYHSRRPDMVLICAGIFEIGSFICGIAPSSTVLIVGRAVAGLGCSGIFSGALIILAHSVSLKWRPIFTGIVASMYGISSVLGRIWEGYLPTVSLHGDGKQISYPQHVVVVLMYDIKVFLHQSSSRSLFNPYYHVAIYTTGKSHFNRIDIQAKASKIWLAWHFLSGTEYRHPSSRSSMGGQQIQMGEPDHNYSALPLCDPHRTLHCRAVLEGGEWDFTTPGHWTKKHCCWRIVLAMFWSIVFHAHILCE